MDDTGKSRVSLLLRPAQKIEGEHMLMSVKFSHQLRPNNQDREETLKYF